MPGLEGAPRPTAEEFMKGVAISRGRWPVDRTNAEPFLAGIAYMAAEHGYQPPGLGDHSSEEYRPYETDQVGSPKRQAPLGLAELVTLEAVPDPKGMIGRQ
ncbi:hypothetical protein HYW35_02700 [Candidatus Saccharibacteria bacterium]|nr:hypothetical protein [Candidatus Saccharibacteria bacterium]